MKKVQLVMALVFVMIAGMLLGGCAEDIILPEEESLVGDWEGTYTVIENFNSPTEADTTKDYILWEFGETNYIMSPDTINHVEGVCFCYGYGDWGFTEGVRLKKRASQPNGQVGCHSCNDSQDPDGEFRKEDANATLILKQLIGTTYKELRLTRVAPAPGE